MLYEVITYSELIDFAYYEKSVETVATKKGEETIKTMELIPVISLVDFKKIDDYLMCFTPYKIKAHIDMFKARIARMMAKLRSPMDYMMYLIIGAIAIAIVWIIVQNTGSTGLDLSPETIAAIKGTATTVVLAQFLGSPTTTDARTDHDGIVGFLFLVVIKFTHLFGLFIC